MTDDSPNASLSDRGRLWEAARQQFEYDLPQLLREHLGYWVAYHGGRQVGIALHSGELHKACREQHLSLDEVMLFEVVSPDQEIVIGPMAFD